MDKDFDNLTKSLPDISYRQTLTVKGMESEDKVKELVEEFVKTYNTNSLRMYPIPLLTEADSNKFYMNNNVSKLIQGTADPLFSPDGVEKYTFEFCNFKDATIDVYGNIYFFKDCFIDGLTLDNVDQMGFAATEDSAPEPSFVIFVIGKNAQI